MLWSSIISVLQMRRMKLKCKSHNWKVAEPEFKPTTVLVPQNSTCESLGCCSSHRKVFREMSSVSKLQVLLGTNQRLGTAGFRIRKQQGSDFVVKAGLASPSHLGEMGWNRILGRAITQGLAWAPNHTPIYSVNKKHENDTVL